MFSLFLYTKLNGEKVTVNIFSVIGKVHVYISHWLRVFTTLHTQCVVRVVLTAQLFGLSCKQIVYVYARCLLPRGSLRLLCVLSSATSVSIQSQQLTGKTVPGDCVCVLLQILAETARQQQWGWFFKCCVGKSIQIPWEAESLRS